MENKKVVIESLSTGRVGIDIPELHLRRRWEKKGAKTTIDLDTLKEAIYYKGVSNLFTDGFLKIDDLNVKIELGLEPEGATEPENIIILNDSQKQRLLTVAPIRDLKEMLGKIPYEQVQELVDYAIEHEITDINRCEVLKTATGIDVIKAVLLRRQAKEG